MGLIHGDVHVAAAGQLHLRPAGGIGAALAALERARGGEQLGTVTDRGNRLVGDIEVLHQRQHLGVQAQVLGRAAAGDQQRVVILRGDLGEIEVQGEVMPGLLAVCLLALEVVDGGAHALPGQFVRANRMHGMADHL